ncbi:MAG: virulence protein RhuM/Fic/DOC family protein [Actinobacteria bacterium]|nr:virulence protein RhuM/Fic/DOC family protein [Actinomycetota bacterium]
MKRDEIPTEQKPKGEIVIYTADGQAQIEVRLEEETVWLTQGQMAELFDRDQSVLSRHIKNVFKEGELDEKSNMHFLHIPNSDKPVAFYNLDVIISVGYRVKSKRGTQFRIWATRVLKEYLVKGYALDQKRLLEQSERKLGELQQAINFIQNKASHPELEGQAEELLRLINEYSNSLTLLYQYDEGKLVLSKGRKPGFVLKYEESQELINELKTKLAGKGEAGSLFGQEYGEKFKGVIAAIYQTFDGEDLYPSIEEKSANLLYLTIKDHPFADGNKRIGSLLFIYFLEQNNALLKESGERKISDTALVALALLVATSNPKEKDVMIKIITNLLRG